MSNSPLPTQCIIHLTAVLVACLVIHGFSVSVLTCASTARQQYNSKGYKDNNNINANTNYYNHYRYNNKSKSYRSNRYKNRPSLSTQPNIIFVLADDLGFGEVGYHSGRQRRALTPTIDQLARTGVRLENYYVEPKCTPTRSQLLSGRSQIHTGLQHKNILPKQALALPLDSPTLADKLKEAGYSTHMVGKWHLGFYKKDYLPTSRGFDSFYGLYLGSGDHYKHSQCKTCSIDLHNDTPIKQRGVADKSDVYSTHLFTKKAVDIINSHSSKNKYKHQQNPLFLFLSYQAVHSPLQVPKRYRKVVKRKLRNLRHRSRLSKAAMTYAMDQGINQVHNALKRKGLWDNTIFIFSTDNGAPNTHGGVNLPLRGFKGTFYEGGIRSVGFVNSQLLRRTGYINRELMHVTDWYPTLVRLANGTLEGTLNVNGYDQWKTISRKKPSRRTEILHNIDPMQKSQLPVNYSLPFDVRWHAAIRRGDFKLITGLHKHPGYQLFNIRKDPLEKKDLVHSYPSRVLKMLTRLQYYQQTAVPVNFPYNSRIPRAKFVGPWK